MYYLRLILICVSLHILTGCTPLSVISAVGTTITNAAYNQADRNLKDRNISPTQRDTRIAIANINLGLEYMNQGNYEWALDKLTRAKAAKSDYAPTYNALGLLYQRMGDIDEAEKNFKRSIKLDGSDPASLNNYGLFLCRNQRFDKAEDYFLKAANDPFYSTPEVAFANAGICALSNEQDEIAEEYFNQALVKNPDIATVLIQMAELHYGQGKYLSARDFLQRYLKLSKHTSKSLWLGIRIEQVLGDKNAISSYALLLRNNFPDTNEAERLKKSEIK